MYTTVNAAGDGHLLRWHQNEAGELVLRKRAKVTNTPITALDISADGSLIGLGTAEGAFPPILISDAQRRG